MQLISWATLQGSLELGIIYAIMALGVFISFRTLNIPDLTVDGSFTLGAAVSAILVGLSQPFTGLALAFLAGCIAGMMTAMLTTKLKIQPPFRDPDDAWALFHQPQSNGRQTQHHCSISL